MAVPDRGRPSDDLVPTDVIEQFFVAATAPREAHASGTLESAEAIRASHPDVSRTSIFAAALVADEDVVRAYLSLDASLASVKGGPFGWDALTYLCFSRYLRLDATRSDAFIRTANALLDAGASATTGWGETIDTPPRTCFESAIYGAAGVAHHVGVTRLLLDHGADPNDEETPYHAPETYDNAVLALFLERCVLTADSLTTMLIRKADWHDAAGMQLLLEHGADPNRRSLWSYTALHQALRRDNALSTIELLVRYGADPSLPNPHDGQSAMTIAARRGRGAVLEFFTSTGAPPLTGVEALLAACALDDRAVAAALLEADASTREQLDAMGGTALARFAGNGNVTGVRCLLDCGVRSDARDATGDAYFDIAPGSTALHAAAWLARPDVVQELIARGTPVNATDGRGRTALQLAVKATVDSYWTNRRSPASVAALLAAGGSVSGVVFPSGYTEVDALLRPYMTT